MATSIQDGRQFPTFIEVQLDWFYKCFVRMRWVDVFSFWFRILAVVRQGRNEFYHRLCSLFIWTGLHRLIKAGSWCRLSCVCKW